jgi:hypothetical protein
MAVTTDIGNPFNIHPVQKQEVGERLAAEAMRVVYGKPNLLSTGRNSVPLKLKATRSYSILKIPAKDY